MYNVFRDTELVHELLRETFPDKYRADSQFIKPLK